MKIHLRIFAILTMLLLMAGGTANKSWAATVTYHILTLPINPSSYDYKMKAEVTGHRLEAFKVVVKDQATVELPTHYKSPLATGFTYYKPDGITSGGSAISLYDDVAKTKGILYDVKNDATPVAEGTAITTNTAEYYVVYTYNASNTIAKLDGSVNYNIGVKGKGFLSLNRGRNNRPAVIPTAKVDPEMLASEDFSYVDNPANNITLYWSSGDNKNKESDTKSKFFFGFKFEGNDPYHIIIRTTYAKDTTYIEKNEGTKNDFVYKWYKESSLFAKGAGNNAYLASDEHRLYNLAYNINTYPTNPTNLTEGVGTGYITKTGYYHGHGESGVWSTVALLNNTSNNGYVLMGTRTVDGNGSVPAQCYYMTFAGYDNMKYSQITSTDATKDHTIDGIYPLKKVTFKIATPFYAAEQSSDHIISVPDWVSQYTVDNDDIEIKYLPKSLMRKYCQFTGKFYKDAACTQEITRYSQATEDPTEGYQVYIGYVLTSDIPFKGIKPAATYNASTWANATWYELTDEGSTQTDGLKLKYDGTNFKNNGADGVYDKTTEFAFIGDPYELRVVYRNATSGASPSYVGAAGTSPATGTLLTASTTDSEGYKWELPYETTAGSFLLKKYKDDGYWYWDAGHPSPVAISYSTKAHTYNVATANAQTVTINVSNLGFADGDYILVTAGGTNADQVTVTSEKIYVQKDGTASFAAAIKGRGDSNKTFTLSVQKYNQSNVAQGTAAVITINQNNGTFTANTVEYSTVGSTRVKVMTLPTRSFTYNIVDKSGRIAVKASVNQTIFSPLSLASIPSIIVSPFLYGETVTFYRTFDNGSGDGTGTSRAHLSNAITELTAGNAATSTDVYVKYTTTALNSRPINLSEDQELNVKLNGYYVYYDKSAHALKTNASPTSAELSSSEYLWKLRNRDPYAMLIDNIGAREDLHVSGQSESVTVYDDSSVGTSQSRQKGAWMVLAAGLGDAVGFNFSIDRANAQRFVAKSSLQTGVYEVMVADGGTVDASTTYYNIGCPEVNTVKIYNNTTYAHGHDVLRFVLNQNIDYVYHLIDKAKHELLTASSKNPELALPAEYQSPLVETYHFYDQDNITESDGEYTVNTPATELSSLIGLLATATAPSSSDATSYDDADANHKHADAVSTDDINEKAKKLTVTGNHYYKIGDDYYVVNVTKACYYDIYVTYDVNDIVNFNKGQYMLKFLEPFADGYHLEDGNDKLTANKIQAVYPYCNGDGNMNVYGSAMQSEQFNGGASTRPRWVWYFVSDNKDPYHVSIRSKSNTTYNGISNNTYLTTYAVHFNQDADPNTMHVVTGGTLPGIASEEPTEYMVLGTKSNYKLLTTNEINDGTTTERRKVTSLEQYWKTYNMLKLDVLGINKNTDAYSEDATTWVVPDSLRTVLETKLDNRGVGTGKWHSYRAYANATRWNGYNDKSNGSGKKVVENIEHWFQTFDMGNGTFDIESADIPPVLVLLDRHGWEIMRRPLPNTTTYPEGEELKGLREFDSPLVDKYYFYSNASKASGCHKYLMRLKDGAERDQIKVNGVRYSSSSLADLPPITATGVLSDGAIQDFYVIYTVKEEYEKNYDYTLDYTEVKDANGKVTGYNINSETGISQPYLVLQNGRFYKTENSASPNTSYISKPIGEQTNPEGGNVYDLIVSPKNHGGNNDNIIDGSGNFLGNNFWYVKPNINIDEEMGIVWGTALSGTGEPLSKAGTKVTYKDKSGFDPYNIQLQLVNKNDGTADGRYLTTHMTSARLEEGILKGDYENGGTKMITLEPAGTATVAAGSSEGHDHTDMRITNQTFMAVSDANGNMQLMPRFDHTQRVDLEAITPWETKLKDPVDHAVASLDNNASQGSQTTFFVRPQRFHYHIIDNNGREALSYKRPADAYPAITEHFKSPLAKDFTYYTGLAEYNSPEESSVEEWGPAAADFKKTLTEESLLADAIKLLPNSGTYYYRIGTRGEFTYKKVVVTKGLSEKQITGSLAAANLDDVDNDVFVRYAYDKESDLDGDEILYGKWFTVKLAGKDLQADGTIVVSEGAGTGVNLYADSDNPTRPATIDASAKKWQWKFLRAPTDPSSDYYVEPDPYAIQIFNREANYTTNPTVEPSPMAVPIKIPNANDGADRYALLNHSSGGYALAVAKEYDRNYNYIFLNGADMTAPGAGTPQAATTAVEKDFNYKAGTLTTGAQVLVESDVVHNFTYNVITNANKLAITANQNNEEAGSHNYAPYLPESVQTPLLNTDDYLYYGFATNPEGDIYSVNPQTILYTLYGLYDDVVYVRYNAYNMDNTSFKVPNKKTIDGGHVARDPNSVDVSMNIDGGLPYNIVWYNDSMMQSTDNLAVSYAGSHALSGSSAHVWYFTGNDPYALKIKHKGGKYLNGTSTLADEANAPTFMLLQKAGYDYGVLQLTGTTGANAGKKLTGYGGALTADANTDPTKFVIFGLSIHHLIYHLVIAKTCPDKNNPKAGEYVDIPYRETISGDLGKKRIFGTTQRDLTAVNDGEGTHYDGEKYQLGSTLEWNGAQHTYSYDAGTVSIGDDLILPNIFYRPNCLFDFYVEGIYQHFTEENKDEGQPYEDMESKYKGLKLTKLMSDEELIDQTVVINVVYKFDTGLSTNSGMDFVTSVDQNLWYTFETTDATPQLAHYTFVRGMRAERGRELHYTNDYLWTPVGDPYGFRSYNRYIYKNNGQTTSVLTTDDIADGEEVKMGVIASNDNRGIYELLPGATPGSGTFRVHPLLNTDNTIFLSIVESGNPADIGKMILSDDTPIKEWTYGLGLDLLTPYYQGAGNVGGLTPAGKTAYETAQTTYADDPLGLILELQNICYDDANIVQYSPGYYRLRSQTGASSLSPVRYASGYLHDIEKTAGTGDAPIPMHFYSRAGTSTTFGEGGLGSGFTETNATRGEIPVPATESDASAIFLFTGTKDAATMQTQGLYVKGEQTNTDGGYAVMTENAASATSFKVADVGGAVVLIYNDADSRRHYINYNQGDANHKYDLQYYENVPVDGSKWCMEPAKSMSIATNNGGDGYYYSTFYAPFDVLLPADKGNKTYNAYVCKTWDDAGLNPSLVPAVTAVDTTYAEGKFVPAGTPVIIRTSDETNSVTLSLPSTSPTASSITTDLTGSYLEKLLPLDTSHDAYTLGLYFVSNATIDRSTGVVTAPLVESATTGVGFYINATPNKEYNSLQSLWQRNNRYVLHNKIYYRGTGGGGAVAKAAQFVPVNFDFEDEPIVEIDPEEGAMTSTGSTVKPELQGVYDMIGRKVIAAEEMSDNQWRQRLSPGLYIVNGRKMHINGK